MSDIKPEIKPDPEPRIILTFRGESADIFVAVEGSVSQGQLYAAAFLLYEFAREQRAAALETARSQQRTLVVPTRH